MGRSVYALLNSGAAWDSLSTAQQRRYRRDCFYYSSAGEGHKHVRVKEQNVIATRWYDRSRTRHADRNQDNGFHANSLSLASAWAFRNGHIDAATRASDRAVNKTSCAYRHAGAFFPQLSTRDCDDRGVRNGAKTHKQRKSWADESEDLSVEQDENSAAVEASLTTECGAPLGVGASFCQEQDENRTAVAASLTTECGAALGVGVYFDQDPDENRTADAASLTTECGAPLAVGVSFSTPNGDLDHYGHLQTFYLPIAHCAVKTENVALMAANQELCSRIALLEDELHMSQLRCSQLMMLGWQMQTFGDSSCEGASYPSGAGCHPLSSLWQQSAQEYSSLVPLKALEQRTRVIDDEGSESQFMRACDQIQHGPGSELPAFPSPPSLPCDQLQCSAGSELTPNLVDDLRESIYRRIEQVNSSLREHLTALEQRMLCIDDKFGKLEADLKKECSNQVDALELKESLISIDSKSQCCAHRAFSCDGEDVIASAELKEEMKESFKSIEVADSHLGVVMEMRKREEEHEEKAKDDVLEERIAKDSFEADIHHPEKSLSFSELLAKFEKLQVRKMSSSIEDEPEAVPIVDMGVYVSNSFLEDSLKPFSDCNPHLEVDDNEFENSSTESSGDSDSESRTLAKQIREMGYDPELEADDFGNMNLDSDEEY